MDDAVDPRETLVNLAVDEALAVAIGCTVNGGRVVNIVLEHVGGGRNQRWSESVREEECGVGGWVTD